MNRIQFQKFESILAAHSLQDVQRITQELVEQLGFRYFIYLFIRNDENTQIQPQVVQLGSSQST